MRCLKLVVVLGATALAGCGTTFYSPDNSPSNKLGNLLAFNSTRRPDRTSGPGTAGGQELPGRHRARRHGR